MRYALSLFVLAVLTCTIGTPVASAHEIETDGDIQGVMHISPAHKPTAGEPAHFEFFMSHMHGSFQASAYAYALTITGEDMATATVPVRLDGDTLRADYTFSHEAEDDTATLVGSSTAPGQPSFSLDFDDITVLPAGQHEDWFDSLLEQHGDHVALVAIIVIAFAAIVGYDKFVVRRRKS